MRIRIPRNGQDIVAKYLTSACAGEVLQVLGILQPTVIRALPTELPRVIVRQTLTDIVLETATGTWNFKAPKNLLSIDFLPTT